jgi:hypothetical protein
MRVANVGDYALLNGRSRAALHFRQREQHQHSFCAICALTKDPLQLVLATCRRDAARQARSSPAPLCLGHRRPASFRGGRATLENLRRVDARSSSVGVCLHAHAFQDQPVRAGSSRGHQTPGPGRHRGAGHAGLAHRQRASRKEPSSAASARGGHLGEPLASAAMRDIVKERCALAGVEGEFSEHSLRVGFVTEAGKPGDVTAGNHGDDRAPQRGHRDGLFPGRELAQQQGQPHAR